MDDMIGWSFEYAIEQNKYISHILQRMKMELVQSDRAVQLKDDNPLDA
jgi:hypothetical protein